MPAYIIIRWGARGQETLRRTSYVLFAPSYLYYTINFGFFQILPSLPAFTSLSNFDLHFRLTCAPSFTPNLLLYHKFSKNSNFLAHLPAFQLLKFDSLNPAPSSSFPAFLRPKFDRLIQCPPCMARAHHKI